MQRRMLLALLLTSCAACSGYTGGARALRPDSFRREPGWIFVRHVPLLRQQGDHDCGPTALAMVVEYYQPQLRDSPWLAARTDVRASAADLRDRARALGMNALLDFMTEWQATGRVLLVVMPAPPADTTANLASRVHSMASATYPPSSS